MKNEFIQLRLLLISSVGSLIIIFGQWSRMKKISIDFYPYLKNLELNYMDQLNWD